MATTRRRVARGRGQGLSPQIRALFDVGCGWNGYRDEEVQKLWNEYGPQYLRTRQVAPEHGPCFAEICLGAPEPDNSED